MFFGVLGSGLWASVALYFHVLRVSGFGVSDCLEPALAWPCSVR